MVEAPDRVCPVCGSAEPHNAHEARCAVRSEHGTRCTYAVQDERHEANADDELRHEDTGGFTWRTLHRGGQHLPVPAAEPADTYVTIRAYRSSIVDAIICLTTFADEREPDRYRDDYAAARAELAEALREAEGHPAAESVPILDLVRQYGARRATEIAGRGAIAAHAHAEAAALFARIEAEIQRLGENDATGDLQAQRDGDLEPTAERIILRLRRQLSDAHAEVDRLKAELAAEEGGRQQDWVDRLTPPDPLVLTLPQVPEGAVALVGVESGRQYDKRTARPDDEVLWAAPSPTGTRTLITFAGVMSRELGGVRVEMPPPREPRTWDTVEPRPGDLNKVEVAGRIWTFDPEWSRFIDDKRVERRTWAELRTLGPVREVLDA